MKPLFEEKQRYTQWWLWTIVAISATSVSSVFIHALYTQLVLKQPWGDKPMSDEVLIAYSLFTISAMVMMLLIFFNAVLEITIDRSGLTYRYFPVIRKTRRIQREDIQSFEIKKYYLKGYGVRRNLHGIRTVNVKGHMCVEITTHDGYKLLLGTQKPNEFFHALEIMKKRGE